MITFNSLGIKIVAFIFKVIVRIFRFIIRAIILRGFRNYGCGVI